MSELGEIINLGTFFVTALHYGLMLLPLAILFAVTVFMTLRDPRRVSVAIMWGLSLYALLLEGLGLLSSWFGRAAQDVQITVLIAASVGMLLAVFLLAALLIVGGIRLIRRESLTLSHSLTLALGLGILVYIVVFLVSAFTGSLRLMMVLFLSGLPLGYLAFVLVCYVAYAGAYGFWVKRFAPTPRIVVVLGSGLAGQDLTPLLRARMDLGISEYEHAMAEGAEPIFVTSGGQGKDEAVPEAVAMASYARSEGISTVVEEKRSTSTEQNLLYSVQISEQVLGDAAQDATWLAATSDYHAFRTATLMRQLAIEGNAVGSKTPRYFWAAGMLREYIAVLRRHWVINVVMLGLASVPLVVGLVISVASLLTG